LKAEETEYNDGEDQEKKNEGGKLRKLERDVRIIMFIPIERI
jgi:hypothetical protein